MSSPFCFIDTISGHNLPAVVLKTKCPPAWWGAQTSDLEVLALGVSSAFWVLPAIKPGACPSYPSSHAPILVIFVLPLKALKKTQKPTNKQNPPILSDSGRSEQREKASTLWRIYCSILTKTLTEGCPKVLPLPSSCRRLFSDWRSPLLKNLNKVLISLRWFSAFVACTGQTKI